MEIIYFSSFFTPIGNVYVAKSVRGVFQISFPCPTDGDFRRSLLQKSSVKTRRNDSMLVYEIGILKEYFDGKQVAFDFALDLCRGTPFQKRVWEKLQEIPYGECRSYKWVAEQIGSPMATRAVGMANNRNPLPPVIPCHRVIGSGGGLTGYAGGLHIKKYLLEMEYNTRKCHTSMQNAK